MNQFIESLLNNAMITVPATMSVGALIYWLGTLLFNYLTDRNEVDRVRLEVQKAEDHNYSEMVMTSMRLVSDGLSETVKALQALNEKMGDFDASIKRIDIRTQKTNETLNDDILQLIKLHYLLSKKIARRVSYLVKKETERVKADEQKR